jgi:hypothetical protein
MKAMKITAGQDGPAVSVGSRVRSGGWTGTVVAAPPGYFERRFIRAPWLVFVAWDHLGGGATPEAKDSLEAIHHHA